MRLPELCSATPSAPLPAPPSTAIALLFSLACPGLGQAYAGSTLRGLTLWLATLVFLPTTLLLVLAPPSGPVLSLWVGSIALSLLVRVFAVLDAPRIARAARRCVERPSGTSPAFLVLFGGIGVSESLLTPWLVREDVVGVYRMVESSMLPTLADSDRILVNRWAAGDGAAVERGDVIAFRCPSDRAATYVKRVVGLPGDRVTVEGGHVLVNGTPLGAAEPQEKALPLSPLDTIVPRDELFVLGDSLHDSLDSRVFGPVPAGDVVGVVQYALRWKGSGPRLRTFDP